MREYFSKVLAPAHENRKGESKQNDKSNKNQCLKGNIEDKNGAQHNTSSKNNNELHRHEKKR